MERDRTSSRDSQSLTRDPRTFAWPFSLSICLKLQGLVPKPAASHDSPKPQVSHLCFRLTYCESAAGRGHFTYPYWLNMKATPEEGAG